MTQSEPNQPRNIYIGVAIVIALILIGSGVYWYSTLNKSNSNSANSSDTSSSVSVSKQAPIVGKYTGAGSVLSAALNFPQTMIEFKSDKTFILNGDGLSLSLLADPTLQVNGVYPTAKLVASGTYKTVDPKNMDISVSAITLTFL